MISFDDFVKSNNRHMRIIVSSDLFDGDVRLHDDALIRSLLGVVVAERGSRERDRVHVTGLAVMPHQVGGPAHVPAIKNISPEDAPHSRQRNVGNIRTKMLHLTISFKPGSLATPDLQLSLPSISSWEQLYNNYFKYFSRNKKGKLTK